MNRPRRLEKPLKIGAHNEININTKHPETGDPLPVDGWTAELRLRWEGAPNSRVLTVTDPTKISILGSTVRFTIASGDIINTGREGWMEMTVILTDPQARKGFDKFRIYAEKVDLT